MRIQKIEKLNHAGFSNFGWSSSLNSFSDDVNILFGWNGSGKTTFSKVIRAIEYGNCDDGCVFQIKTDNQLITESSNLTNLNDKVRVFNDDYIAATLSENPKIPYIFFAGQEAVDYAEDEKNLEDKKVELSKKIIPSQHDNIAIETAKLIKSVTGINSYRKELTGGSTYASYDKSDFERRINNIRTRIKKGELRSHTELIKDDIDTLKTQLINTDQMARIDNNISTAAQWLLDNINDINLTLESTPIQMKSNRIESLKDREIDWIEKGVALHFSPDHQHANCLFCNSEIANKDELVKHFSEEVVQTIDAVDKYLNKIESFTTDYSKVVSPSSSQRASINLLRSVFDKLTLILREKRNAISTKKDFYILDTNSIKPLTITSPLDATIMAYTIETHHVAERYKAYEDAYADYDKQLKEKEDIENEIRELTKKVRVLKEKAKNTHEPASALNRLFKIVFPFRKIQITDSDDGTGYVLRRNDKTCAFSSLSEGEKNFIALAYFIYALNNAQSKLADDGIVIIDDPVSSLDKQAIFQIFSMIVHEVNKYKGRQYFILTHNLDFLGHLTQHFREKIRTGKIRLFCFKATNGGCVIENIPQLLKDYRSDYYYVFSVLWKYQEECDIESSYLIVNLLRRWLETFLAFKFSTIGDLRSTLETAYKEANRNKQIWEPPFDANHLEMYRFITHGSHGFSDMESTDDAILTNAHLRIKEAFSLVETLDPLHYKKLKEVVSNTS